LRASTKCRRRRRHQRPPAKPSSSVWITTSGVFNQPPFIAALQTFGIDRIMFSVDYPFAPDARGRDFLDEVALSPSDMAKLTHGNADKLLRLKA
jgi:predicted TIM-barrel fold metal-dependent hydrolase